MVGSSNRSDVDSCVSDSEIIIGGCRCRRSWYILYGLAKDRGLEEEDFHLVSNRSRRTSSSS
jgi:hypothetical protein